MKTYGDIYNEFCDKFPNAEIENYRPAASTYIPQLVSGTIIPCAIIVWLKDGSEIIYISESNDEILSKNAEKRWRNKNKRGRE